MKALGIDMGTSSIKVSLLDIESGACVDSSTNPKTEMPIETLRDGWAEQDPEMWWRYIGEGIRDIASRHPMSEVRAIGITYQMHGLVCLDREGRPLRKSIIWCDSRAVAIGDEARDALGRDRCLERLLNSPGNFTASKATWVKRNEPELFARIDRFMLPGDYAAYRLTGCPSTTESGLSEQILWDFAANGRADFLAEHYGLPTGMIPEALPSIGIQARTNSAAEREFGIPEGTPISYRAGDQPNNAFSLNVLDAGEVAATGGTSGVIYGVTDRPEADPQSRVNTFLHVNHTAGAPRYGILLCINGTGILNSWLRRNIARGLSYDEMNALAAEAPAGCEGLTVLPFGNGAERVLENRFTGVSFAGIDLNRHTTAHLVRAAHEGIAFSFYYGLEIMRGMGLDPSVIRAGKANLFLSPLFRETLATLSGARIELFNTDGSLGAARGAALGAGFYASREEAFASLRRLESVEPDPSRKAVLDEAYARWKAELQTRLNRS
ncbi:FGGY family carbohydrate kinase [uncultured Alistipes sp.]|uniref:xylulokinase n=1 Tax=uncultured Alistipes sp. TaxID=538949 RepID=UPI00260BE757|nr:FGGY family carbohydrate kinase [uncultured Alistipes sp.]